MAVSEVVNFDKTRLSQWTKRLMARISQNSIPLKTALQPRDDVPRAMWMIGFCHFQMDPLTFRLLSAKFAITRKASSPIPIRRMTAPVVE
jgi:hypothetical protein